ncbi:MAG TPA: ABC transporter ATP-binding protein [Vicinamibacterales bacterium]|nr:ABC transporter ATP-binding protein [Vicinamibacterales bacterium]
MTSVSPLLSVRGLTTIFDLPGGPAAAVDRVSFDLRPGETLCLVGESGSGKSLTAYSILRIVPPPGRIAVGEVVFKGRDLLRLPEHEMQRVRGGEIGLVFQEPASALDPVFTIGALIAETLLTHGRAASRRDARARAIEILRRVSIPDPDRRVDDYPHQLSGGLRQRAMIALATACAPALLIADEPTTALDATVQAQVLDLLREMRDAAGLALLLITHDLGVVAETADRVAIMYAGRIVEEGPVRGVLRDPKHPYTRALLASIPGGTPGQPLAAIPGHVPALGSAPEGCGFGPRCVHRFEACDTAAPALTEAGPDRLVRCFLHSPDADTASVAPVGVTHARTAD